MAVKNAVQKNWSMPTRWNNRRYSDASKVPAQVAPAAPVLGAITAQAGSVKRVAITTFSSGATHLVREVSLNGGAYQTAGANVSPGATYFDYDVGSATNWSFRARAVNAAGSSGNSNVVTGGSYTPAVRFDFDALTSLPSFFNTYGYGTISNAQAFGGSGKSVACAIGNGGHDWGLAGKLANRLGQGDEIWVRFRTLFPVGYSFSAIPHLKFFRIDQGAPGSDGHGAHIDFYIRFLGQAGDTTNVGFFDYIHENQQQWLYDTPAVPTGIVRGVWQTWNLYFKLHSVAASGRIRLWRDNTLIVDSNSRITLGGSDFVVGAVADPNAQGAMFGTYWNGGAPQAQTCHVDDWEIATSASPPPATDAGGRIWIGV